MAICSFLYIKEHPCDGRHVTIGQAPRQWQIRSDHQGGTFAWDKLEKEKEDEDDDGGEKFRLRDMDKEKQVITAGVSAAHVGLDSEEVDNLIRQSKINKKNPYDEELIAPVLFGVNVKLEKVKDNEHFVLGVGASFS